MTILTNPVETHLARRRARHGAEVLTAVLGPGWVTEVDVEALNIYSETRCVLGQVFGNYARGRRELHLSKARTVALGFTADFHVRFPVLTRAWKRELARLAKRTLVLAA